MVSAKIRSIRNEIVRQYRAGPIGVALAGRKAGTIVKKADRLRAANRVEEAIELLTAENADNPDITLEKKIIQLRREAFNRLPPDLLPARRRLVPERPFDIDECGLPVIEAGELSVETVTAALAKHGTLLIRNLIDPDTASFFVSGLDQGLKHQAAVGKGTAAYAETPFYAPDYDLDKPRGRDFVRWTGGMLTIDSPRLMVRLIDVFRTLGINDLVREYLGERPAISIEKSTLRRMRLLPKASWHQDGAFLGDVGSLNLWIALTPCGTHAPGLEIVSKPLCDMVESGTGDAMFPWCVGDDVAQRVAGEGGIACPEFGIGDAVIFDHTNLHRTHLTPEMKNQRYAIETWFFAPSKFPGGYTGLLL